jgi:hypothetical protein
MLRAWTVLLPELRRLAPAARAAALARARQTPLDALELVGMALGLIAVTALTKLVVPADPTLATRLAMALLSFAVAAPLLLLTLGPFHLRRLRRGLRAELSRDPPG